jgi:hypothetical protein
MGQIRTQFEGRCTKERARNKFRYWHFKANPRNAATTQAGFENRWGMERFATRQATAVPGLKAGSYSEPVPNRVER